MELRGLPHAGWIVAVSLVVYLATSYGGIRSPDAEILFEACDALKSRRTFAIEPESAWEGFGLAKGRNGELYSIFGPLQSIACVPFLAAVDVLGPEKFFNGLGLEIPPSHYVPGGLQEALHDEPVDNRMAHARRSVLAWLWGCMVSALGVGLFFRIARRFSQHPFSVVSVTTLYALGTPTWSYAGTFFSEPLATLLLLASFDRLLESEDRGGAQIAAGTFLGLAAWAHITALLFVPFFVVLFALQRPTFRRAICFAVPLVLLLAGLGGYHFVIFGSPFETGRSVGGTNQYATFVAPWRGIYGLLLSPGKGMFVHVPIAILAIIAWPTLLARHRPLGLVLGGTLVFRLLFIASRSDWHGGFSPGPRLLMQAMPFLLLGLIPWVTERVGRRTFSTYLYFSLGLVSLAMQWLLVAGEPFALLHAFRLDALGSGQNVFEGDSLYLEPEFSVLGRILEGPVGPLLFRSHFATPAPLWVGGMYVLVPTALVGAIVMSGGWRIAGPGNGGPLERHGPLLLAAFVLALFLPTLTNGFTNWDDPQYVQSNPFARRGFLGIPLAFLGSHEDAYYPVTHAIYSVIQAFFGTSALAHHAVQVGLFAAGVALLPWALAAFGVPSAAGFWIALIWAVHPMRAESVSWVANLKDPAAFLGLVIAFGAYGQGRRKLSTLAFTLALLAKSMFFPLAGLFVLLEGRRVSWREALRRAGPYLVVAFAVALLGAFLHVFPSEARARTRPGGSLLGAIPSILYLPWWYLWRTLSLRHPQSVYTYDAVGWLDPRHFFSLGGWVLAFLLLWRLPREKRPPWILGLAAWTLPFLPVTGLVPLVQPVADRYAFLPSLALMSAVVLGLRSLAPRLPGWAPATLLALAVGGQALASIPRQLDYRSAITLWEADLPREPESWTVRFNLAGAYGGEGRWEEAIVQLEKAQAIRPSQEVERWLAFARLAQRGLPSELVPIYSQRLAVAEDEVVVWLDLTRELVRMDRLVEAEAVLEDLPDDRAEVLFFRGMLLAAEGRSKDALRMVAEAIAREPGLGQAHLFRAELLAEMGRDEELVRLADVPVEDSRDRALLAKARAMAFLRMRRFEEALAATEVEIEEEHRPILSAARAASLLLLGRKEEALRVARAGDGPGADRLLLQTVLEQAGE